MPIFNFDGGRKMVRNLIIILMVAVVGIGVVFVAGCESDAQTGALIGTGIGAGVGQAIGGDAQSTILGGVVGGSLGYGIGNEGDKKKAAADRQAIRNEMNIVTVNVTRKLSITFIQIITSNFRKYKQDFIPKIK